MVGFESIVELSDAVISEFSIRYSEAIQGEANKLNFLTKEIVTNTEAVNIPFINRWDQLDELELHGDIDYSTVTGEYINRRIKRFGKGLNISKFSWEAPESQSILMTRLDALVAEAAFLRSRRIAYNLNNGDSIITAYDGQNLFSNTHTLNGITFDNLLAGNTLDATGFNNAREVLKTVPLGKDGSYLPTEMATFYIVIPSALEELARLTLANDYIYEDNKTSTNPWKGAAEMVVSSLLTDPNDWYLLMTLPGISPFATIKHNTSSASLIAHVSESDPNVEKNAYYEWTCQVFEETYPVHFYQMVKCTNS